MIQANTDYNIKWAIENPILDKEKDKDNLLLQFIFGDIPEFLDLDVTEDKEKMLKHDILNVKIQKQENRNVDPRIFLGIPKLVYDEKALIRAGIEQNPGPAVYSKCVKEKEYLHFREMKVKGKTYVPRYSCLESGDYTNRLLERSMVRKSEQGLINTLLIRGGVESNPGPKVRQGKMVSDMPPLDYPDSFSNYNEGTVFIDLTSQFVGDNLFVLQVNDVKALLDEYKNKVFMSFARVFDRNLEMYENYRVMHVRIEICYKSDGQLQILPMPCTRKLDSMCDLNTVRMVPELICNKEMRNQIFNVDGWRFYGCREVSGDQYVNSSERPFLPLYYNIAFRGEKMKSNEVSMRIGIRLQFFNRKRLY